MHVSRSLIGVSTRTGSRGLRFLRPNAQLLPVAGTARRYTDAITVGTSTEGEKGTETLSEAKTREAWLFVDSVFPLMLAAWDPRQYFGALRQETVCDQLSALLGTVKAHDFHVLSIEPQMKDGGAFVKFSYSAGEPQAALDTIMTELRRTADKEGGMPSWMGVKTGSVWLVKGKPWREDMHRYASPIVKVAFEGPDVKEEALYDLLRPYGRILDLKPPIPVPAGTPRSAMVTFRHVRSAAIARNTIHGYSIPSDTTGTMTRLRTSYEQPIQAHAVKDYISNHPRIFLPILFFLIGSLTYTVFDPVRVFMVEGKLNDWFDHRQYRLYQWFKSTMIESFSLADGQEHDGADIPASGIWKERQDAEAALVSYISDLPSAHNITFIPTGSSSIRSIDTVAFVFGPQGSGKTHMVRRTIQDTHRKALVIDVAQLSKVTSDAALVAGLASQTGYWPVFSFLNSVNNLIDLASVGVIGQKAGLSSSLTDQLKQVLEVVGTGLRSVNVSYRKQRQKQLEEQRVAQLRAADEARTHERIVEGIWHDPRLDCVAGNGVMCELGVGDEFFGEADSDIKKPTNVDEKDKGSDGWSWNWSWNWNGNGDTKKPTVLANMEELRAIEAMPIVVINNFDSKGSNARKTELLDVLAQWAATLADNGVAHVIVVSDNRENAKQLAKALPSKPLNIIALSDADSASALSLVKEKLRDANIDTDFGHEETSYIERLGGRAEDLESLVHKVRSGMTVEQAVEDIIRRGLSELRKSAFGDDTEDAKTLPWAREQAWFLMKQLAKKGEIPYYELLVDLPFKGDETALREMEHAELISIITHHGRPSVVKPGKPVYKYVFERLVEDSVFQANQDFVLNQKIIAANEAIVKACEEELLTLKEVEAGTSHWWGSRKAVSSRGEYLLKKMRVAVEKIEALEKQNAAYKRTLSKAA
ncbi:hypothetical protein NM688_g7243 [Phlebia brevispora]|uniref:Uncharacterized protein n=1 Tax=Phlebia brevispora TaxID=194682 RepID=A0ACC1S7J0_9APHY|nr:hypothetical protein NM688_g7243 [Phlebia brevispora]